MTSHYKTRPTIVFGPRPHYQFNLVLSSIGLVGISPVGICVVPGTGMPCGGLALRVLGSAGPPAHEAGVLVAKSCHNKVPRTGWFIKSRNVFLLVQEAKGLKSRCWLGHNFSKGSKERILPCLFHLLVAPGLPWLVAASPRLCLHLHVAVFSLGVFVSKSPIHHKDTSHWMEGPS